MQFFMNQANILIVGYCYYNCKTLIEMLNQKEYSNINKIINRELCLQLVRKDSPDIILIETGLYNTDIYEFCKKLKSEDYFKDISIIFISEENDLDRNKIFASGANDYLTIPLNREEVFKRIEMQLQFRFMQLELKKCENRQSYYEQKKLNDQLIVENNKLKIELFEKNNS